MRLTKKTLRRIIREELNKQTLNEELHLRYTSDFDGKKKSAGALSSDARRFRTLVAKRLKRENIADTDLKLVEDLCVEAFHDGHALGYDKGYDQANDEWEYS